jgi:hypothetical protein
MALLNFKSASEDKLRGILGSYNTEEDRARLRFSDSYVEKNYYKVTQIIQGTVVGSEETYTEYKAIQVNPDGTEVQNGIVFDSDQTYTSNVNSPLYLPNLKINEELFTGAVELGKAYQVEEIDPEDFSGGLEPVYYIIPKGGGGGVDFYYAIFKSKQSGQDYLCDVYPDALFNPEGSFEANVLVRVFNIDYGEVLPNAKLKCWPADSNELGIKYYAEAPTWQQDLP